MGKASREAAEKHFLEDVLEAKRYQISRVKVSRQHPFWIINLSANGKPEKFEGKFIENLWKNRYKSMTITTNCFSVMTQLCCVVNKLFSIGTKEQAISSCNYLQIRFEGSSSQPSTMGKLHKTLLSAD